nr:PREDICTED: cytochrome P450 CYP82H23-like [Daucus carota subsp. sativus]
MADKLGPVFLLQLGIHKTLVVSSWEVARECFTVHDKALSTRPMTLALKIMGYDGAIFGFLPYGPKWRNLRKLVMVELLSTRRLDKLKHILDSEVNLFVRGLYELWKSKGEEGMPVVELTERFGDLTTNIVVRMVAGKRYFGNGEYKNEEARWFQKASKDFLHMVGLFMVSDAVPLFGWVDSLTGYKGKMKKTAIVMDNILEGWMKEHKQKRKLASINESEQDFMHVMLSIMESDPDAQISDTTIKGTCLSLLLGGYDTTMVTLTWAVSLLLNHRHVLRKVQDELEKHVGRDRQVNESDVKNLPYLRAIVKETLRLYPPAPLNGPHEAIEDCTLAGFHISAGTRLFANLWKLQRDPRIWSDPLDFRPDRFIEEHVDVEMWGQNFELIPFGSGRRACPGTALALQVLHLTLAQLLQGFKLGTVSDLPIDMTESPGFINPKATPLEVAFRPRLAPSLYA